LNPLARFEQLICDRDQVEMFEATVDFEYFPAWLI
jgi:hypothetical protein